MKLLGLLSMLICFIALSEERCGDGPIPLSDITKQFGSDVQLVKTESGMKDFLFLEKKNSILYRRPDHALVYSDLSNSGKSTTIADEVTTPISRILDRNENLALAEGESWLFNFSHGKFLNFHLPTLPIEHLFWKYGSTDGSNVLFSLSGDEVFYLKDGHSIARKLGCNLTEHKAGLRLAKGHQYPNINLFSTVIGTGGKTQIFHYELDVNRCNLTAKVDLEEVLIDGTVEDVYHFPELNAKAIKIDHATKNLLWRSRAGCFYADIHNVVPFIPNTSQPFIVTPPTYGAALSIINLYTRSKARLLDKFPLSVTGLNKRALAMTRDGRSLYVAPNFDGEEFGRLVKLTVNWPTKK